MRRAGIAWGIVVALGGSAAITRGGASAASPSSVDGRNDKGDKGDKSADGTVVAGEEGKQLDAFMLDAKNFPEGFNGCVLVARDGKVLLAKGYGVAKAQPPAPMRADALWDWCSVTKQFTAAAVLKLEMQKKLKLDDPLKKFFKDVPKDKANLTLRQLMNHTSGLNAAPPDHEKFDLMSRDAAVDWILAPPVASEPGKKWEYNNAAYFLLGALIEKVSGQTYEQFLREQLFEPSGMKGAGFIGDGKADHDRVPLDERGTGVQFAYGPRMSWGYRGAGGALASVFDMLKWDQALRGDKVLSKAAKEEYYTVGLQDYALGWEVTNGPGGKRAEHSGHTGHVITYFFRRLDSPLVVALAYSYEPKTHPKVTANAIAQLAMK
jgi:CubicO group peptidase (beta-lactamase class C family)